MKKLFSVFILINILWLLQGCVAVQTFPVAARPGDTISLSVGSPDGMTKQNTQIYYLPEGGDPVTDSIDLTSGVRAIFKLRPDNTSYLGVFSPSMSSVEGTASHSAWLTVIVIDLPVNVPPGFGDIHISTAAETHAGPDINDNPVAIEIIQVAAGQEGSPSTFDYRASGSFVFAGDLSQLEPMKQVVVKPPLNSVFGQALSFHAVEFKLRVVTRELPAGTEIPTIWLRVVQDDQSVTNARTQAQMYWSRQGDIFTVNILSPEALMRYSQNRFSLVIRNDLGGNTHSIDDTDGPELLSVKYYDHNGNLMTNSGLPEVSDYAVVVERP